MNDKFNECRENEMAATYIEKILDHLEVNHRVKSNRILADCPHCGAELSMSIYTPKINPKTVVPTAVCFKNGCSNIHGKSIVRAIQGYAGAETFAEAVKFVRGIIHAIVLEQPLPIPPKKMPIEKAA